MKFLFILFLFLFPIKAVSQSLLDSFYKPIDRYKIQRIDSIKSVYVIYIKKGDKIFKIVSPKSDSQKGIRIKRGKYYNLQLASHLDASKISQKLDISGISIGGVLVKLEGKKVIWDLFDCKNLDGLFLKQY
jgi:hypothetical protein